MKKHRDIKGKTEKKNDNVSAQWVSVEGVVMLRNIARHFKSDFRKRKREHSSHAMMPGII